jgi:hypothetical protein
MTFRRRYHTLSLLLLSNWFLSTLISLLSRDFSSCNCAYWIGKRSFTNSKEYSSYFLIRYQWKLFGNLVKFILNLLSFIGYFFNLYFKIFDFLFILILNETNQFNLKADYFLSTFLFVICRIRFCRSSSWSPLILLWINWFFSSFNSLKFFSNWSISLFNKSISFRDEFVCFCKSLINWSFENFLKERKIRENNSIF